MPADLVFLNGPVFCADAAGSLARAVTVEGDRIVAVGGEREAMEAIGPSTEVVDLAGRMLLPGFQDAHVHPAIGGRYLMRCDLLPSEDAGQARSVIQAYAHAHPDAPWILGGGWSYSWFERGTPSATMLDELTGDRPAYLVVRDGHSGWANSAALRAAGVDAGTPDPADGRIERLPGGEPQGTLHEGAMDLVERVLPEETHDDLVTALSMGQDHLLSLGVTAWQDAWVEAPLHAAYRTLAGRGELVASVRGALWWDRSRGTEQLEWIRTARSEGIGRYVPGAVKLMLDGVCENFTASMLDPYLPPAEGRGIDMIDPDQLAGIVIALDAEGIQCHFHAIGDAAVRLALDAVEAARLANGWSDLRPTIAHIQVIHPDDLPRFRRLGVIPNMQPLWAQADEAMTELTLPFLGPERGEWQYPFRALIDAGATAAMGSDWPVSTADVMAQVHVAVTRTGDDPSMPPFLPDQRVGIPDALRAFTAGSAHVNHLLPDRGTIAPGTVADLVVLGGDPFTAGHLDGLKADLTVVSGRVVYERRR